MDEGLRVATEAVRLAGEAVKANERLLVVLRRDGFFDLVGLLEPSRKIEREGDSEEFFGREGTLLVEEDIRRHRSTYEATEAVENIDRCGVDFGSGSLREETLDDGFGFFFETDIQEGEGFLDARGNFVLAHDFIRKIGRFKSLRPVGLVLLEYIAIPEPTFCGAMGP
jgi:hypothetical protein